MAASPPPAERGPESQTTQHQRSLPPSDPIPPKSSVADSSASNGGAGADAAVNDSRAATAPPATPPSPTAQELESTEGVPRGTSVANSSVAASKGDSFRDRQAKPNKVYIGGLPSNTRIEDLRSCFGKIGHIVQIELKIGYGFVEFDSAEAAEESVAKYNEGYFMGNKIRVEISHGGRATRSTGESGSCFRCGETGHWARECPNAPPSDSHNRRSEPPLIDRIQRDYPPPPRDYPSYRDDYGPPGRLPPSRDSRYYDYPPPPARDYRRPSSPPREYRDYPPPPPPPSRGRDYDDYRRAPPPPPVNDRDRYPPPPPADYRGSRYPPPSDNYRGYGAPPPAPYPYDRYDRRPAERYSGPPYPPPPPVGRPRTPPRHARDDYDRAPPPPRDFPPDYRGRPITPPPPRYPPEYVRQGSAEVGGRYRRRSESPPPRGGYEAPYPPGPPRDPYSNGYGASGPPPRAVSRDYAPRGREVDYRRP